MQGLGLRGLSMGALADPRVGAGVVEEAFRAHRGRTLLKQFWGSRVPNGPRRYSVCAGSAGLPFI